MKPPINSTLTIFNPAKRRALAQTICNETVERPAENRLLATARNEIFHSTTGWRQKFYFTAKAARADRAEREHSGGTRGSERLTAAAAATHTHIRVHLGRKKT